MRFLQSKQLRKQQSSAFRSFCQSFTQGDAISSNAPTTGAVANYSDITSTGSGSAGDLAGTILTSGGMTLTAGGSGTVTGQFVNEVFTID